MLKYTINYDGMYGSFAKIHSENRYADESLALPENVPDRFKKSKEHADVYLFDRGQSSAEAFDRMRSTEALPFIGRLVANRKPHVPKEFDLTFKRFGGGVLKQDAPVQTYGYEKFTSKNGKEGRREFLSKEKYRVIRFHPTDGKEDILLITNMFSVRAELLASMYRRRWNIEVFFGFLKQEVNFSHFISLNKNGIEVMLYMTPIAAMPIMIYKKENEIGFKTAKRRMLMEVQEVILSVNTIFLGGDQKK